MKLRVAVIFALFISYTTVSAQEKIIKIMSHNDELRGYVLYVPASYDSASPMPLLFNFHGWTGSADAMMKSTPNLSNIADTAGFILVYPQGSVLNGNTHWNVGSWTAQSKTDDIGFTEAIIDSLDKEYNIDLNRVYACGFSNGGYFCFELACKLGHRIAGIASVSGTMSGETFNACKPAHPTPILTFHGTADGIVSYEGRNPVGSKSLNEVNKYWTHTNHTLSKAVVTQMPDLNNGDGSTVERQVYGKGDSCVSVEHYKIIDGKHVWPITDTGVNLGANRDINASVIIWNFLSKYDINGFIKCKPTSTDKHSTTQIGVYPNPTSDWLIVHTDLKEPLPYALYSQIGETVISGSITQSQSRINLADLPSNIYLLKIGGQSLRISKVN